MTVHINKKMGHYDSCRDETYDVLKSKCKYSKDGKHDYDAQGGGYGVGTCRNKGCDLTVFWT